MSRRKQFLVLVFAFAAGWFAALFVVAMRPNRCEVHELSGDGLVEARDAFKKFAKKEVMQNIVVPLIEDYKLHIAIVQEFRGAAYGFVESDDLPIHLWARREGLTVYRYDDHHLFVVLSDWLITDISRRSSAAGAQRSQTPTE